MSDKPPFDVVRASFCLVAAVIGVHCVVVLLGAAVCIYEKATVGAQYECDTKGRLGDLLAGVLAAALAFSGGFLRRPPDDKPPT